MDNRYFWIKDRLNTEKIKVEYCPTSIMIADFFTKPLQGSLFKKMRDVVLGYKHVDTLLDTKENPISQERVGKEDIVRSKSMVRAGVSYADVIKKKVLGEKN